MAQGAAGMALAVTGTMAGGGQHTTGTHSTAGAGAGDWMEPRACSRGAHLTCC